MEPQKPNHARRLQMSFVGAVAILLALLIGCSIAGCSGGEGGAAESAVVTPTPTPAPPVNAISNRVRQDVKEKIIARHPNEPQKQEALFVAAVAVQDAIAAATSDDHQNILRADEGINRATQCIISRFPGNSFEEIGFVEIAVIGHDQARSDAYERFNQAFNNTFDEMPDIENPCQ